MRCQVCQEREATIHITEVSAGRAHESHFCQGCGPQPSVAQGKLGAVPSEGSEVTVEIMTDPSTKRKIVHATHGPTGMSVRCDEDLPEERLKEIVLRVLRARVAARQG